MLVKAVVGNIELAVFEPLVERRMRFVEYVSEGLMPFQILARETTPKTLVVFIGLGAQGVIPVHAGDRCIFCKILGRMKDPMLMHQGFDLGHTVSCVFIVFGQDKRVRLLRAYTVFVPAPVPSGRFRYPPVMGGPRVKCPSALLRQRNHQEPLNA